MGHLDHAAADVQRRRYKPIDLQSVEADRGANHVDDSIKRAHFVEVNLIDRLVVHLSLSRREAREDLHCTLLHPIRQPCSFYDLLDVGKVAMFVLLNRLDSRVCRRYTRAIDSLKVDAEASGLEQRKLALQVIRI